MADKERTILLLSGGMNSAVMLYEYLTFKKADIVEAIIFDATTSSDFMAARDLCDRTGVPYSVWCYDPDPVISHITPGATEAEIDRSLLFTVLITHAVHRARDVGAERIAAGFSAETLPFSPDRLIEFCCHAGRAATEDSHLLEYDFPFIDKSKGQIFELAKDLNRVVEVTLNSTSCDNNDDSIQHQWGYGCGSCRGCVARWHAWDEYLQIIGQGPTV